jgi:hypothetical protein
MLLGRRRNKAPRSVFGWRTPPMSGCRQDQYLDQAYHAMALQPVHSAVASEGGLPLVAFDDRGGRCLSNDNVAPYSPVRFGSHRIRTTARAVLSGGQQGSAEDINNLGRLCGPAGRSPRLRRNQLRPVNPARSVPRSRDGRGLGANADVPSRSGHGAALRRGEGKIVELYLCDRRLSYRGGLEMGMGPSRPVPLHTRE